MAARLSTLVQLDLSGARRSGARGSAPTPTLPRFAGEGVMVPNLPLPQCGGGPGRGSTGPRLSEAFALDALTLQLAGAPDCLGRLAGPTLRRLLVVPPQLHLAEDSFPLHLLLERLQR